MRLSDNNTISRLRTNKRLLWAPYITGKITEYMCQYLQNKGFTKLYCPSIDNRKKGQNVLVKYDGLEELELSASSALFLGAASMVYGSVYSIGPAYRVERNLDKSHLVEFELLEVEWKNDREEKLRKFIIEFINGAIIFYNQVLDESHFGGIFNKKNILKDLSEWEYKNIPQYLLGKGITPKAEELGVFYDEQISENLSDKPVWIIHYPSKASWRAKKINDENAMISNLIFPNGYGEIVECSVRENDSTVIHKKFETAGIIEQRKWYVDALETNSEIHSGFGLGIDRFCSWLMELESVEDTQMYPRGKSFFKED